MTRTALILISLAGLAGAVSAHPWAHSDAETAPAHETAAHPATRLPSRAANVDERGYYHAPAALADDYPEESTSEEKIRRDFETLEATGAKHLRFGIGWDGIESEAGKFDWSFWDRFFTIAAEYDVTLIPYVCYTPQWAAEAIQARAPGVPGASEPGFWSQPPKDAGRFGEFMFRIASRYKGKVASWEIWNEPDIPEYWNGTVEQFAELTREGARQVRRADPEARIVLAGMAKGGGPFLAELITEHGAAEWVDIVNVHGYHETWTQDRAESYPDLLRSVRELAGFVSPARDVWFAEFGYSDQRHSPTQVSVWGVDAYYAYEHTPAYQASALWKHHVLAVASESPSLTAWYRINDLPHGSSVIGDANNRHLGILDVHGRPKPAFRALRFYNAFFDEPSRLVNGRQSSAASASSQQVLHLFEEKDGDLIVTGWLRSPLPDEIRLKGKSAGKLKDTRRESLSVQLPSFEGGTKRELTVYDELGNVIADHGVSIDAKGFLTGVELRGERPFIAEIKAPVD